MPITGEALHLQAQLDSAISHTVDSQTRDLVAAWALAWDEVAGDLNATLADIVAQQTAQRVVAASWFARSERLAAILGIIGQRLTSLAEGSQVRILRDLSSVVSRAAQAQGPILRAMLPTHYELPGAPSSAALDAIVKRVTGRIVSDHRPLSREAMAGVRRELIRGVAVGISPRDTAQLMVDRAEGEFNGGLTRALVISRTEILDAHRAAAQASQAAHGDVLVGWVWLTHLTPTTCRSCVAMNGTVHDLSEPGPLDHPQGRCSRMPKTRTWRDLGLDAPEPDDVGVTDTAAWFRSLTVAQQRSILGRDGYQAWKDGRWPMDEWSRRREADGWRASYVPAPQPAVRSGAAEAARAVRRPGTSRAGGRRTVRSGW